MQNSNLENLFNLPTESDSADELSAQEILKTEPEEEITPSTITNLEKIDRALPKVKGLEASDLEMDELASLAIQSYKDLMDFGMSADPRFATDIFGSAGQFLGHAITSKTAKMNKKLKMIDLQLKKAKLDLDNDGPELETADGMILDRNQLLDRARELAKIEENK